MPVCRGPLHHDARDALREGVLEGLVGRNQHGCDQRAVAEGGDAVERHLASARTHPIPVAVGAASAESGAQGPSVAFQLEYLDRLAAAVVRRVHGVAATRGGSKAQSMQQCLLRIERARAGRVFRAIRTRRCGAHGIQVLDGLRLSIDEVQSAARRHAAGQHPPRVRDHDQIFGVGYAEMKVRPPDGAHAGA